MRRASMTSRKYCIPKGSMPTWYDGSICGSATWTGRAGTTCSTPGITRRGGVGGGGAPGHDLLDRVHQPKEEVTVALVGKYFDLPDAYLSVCEALRAGGFANQAGGGARGGAAGPGGGG